MKSAPPVRSTPAAVGRSPTAKRGASREVPEAAFAAGFLLLCALLALVFFREFVFRGGTMPFGTDMIEEAYPLRNFAVEERAAGRPFPAWNPFAYSGIPFLETLPYPVFYPTSLLYFAIPLGRAIGWGFVLHFAAAGILMFALARRLGISRWGAGLAGLAFMFNGYLVSHLYAGQDGRMFAMTLIPLVFLFLRVGLDTGRLGPFLLMGGAVALQIFTPHVQIMYFSSLAVVAYFLAEAIGRWRREGWRPALALTSRFAAGFALAGLVAAVQLWPTLAFLRWAVRGIETGYDYATSWSLPVGELSALVAPDLVGSLASYWGSNPFKLHTEYMGAVPLVLALAGILWGERRRTLFWAVLAVAGLLFALGAATPVHRLAYYAIPMVKSFRGPSMMIAVVAFALAVLAGLGFDALARRPAEAGRSADTQPGIRTRVFFAAAALIVLAWVLAVAAPGTCAGIAGTGSAGAGGAAARAAALAAFPASFAVTALAWLAAAAILWWGVARERIRIPLAAGLLAAVLVVDLWRVDARYLSVVEIDQTFAPNAAERFLTQQQPPFRIVSLAGAMGPNEAILHRLDDVWGLQKFRLSWYDELMGGATAENLSRLPLWRVLNVRYVVAPVGLQAPGLSPVFEGEPTVYAWDGNAPRAWVAAESRVVRDPEALALLSDPDFDPQRVVLLAEPLAGVAEDAEVSRGEPLSAAAPAGPAGEGAGQATFDSAAVGSVRYLERTPNRIEAEVEASAPGVAVFSEVYHPYWQARVDGRPAPVVRADLALRAVPVGQGTHRVTLEYRPRAYERAKLVSLGALVVALGYAALVGWRSRSRGRP